ncbi:MAG: pyruvate formate lyase-activating protein [Candidatus Heimdallarchaeota archaeon]|nr:pyruvate formate lyase-activating protein [Candidatus Heimdallarchaeota archaeon]
MKILAVDIGTGTQDILLADTELDIENSFRMLAPSPTMIAHRRIKAATKAGKPIAISGVMMGGGPSFWAAKDHLNLGFKIFSTKEAAKTFDDDLNRVKEMGVELVTPEEVDHLPDEVNRIEFKDFDHLAIAAALNQFGVKFDDIGIIAVGVFDHGNAPPNYSDRQFRFDYITKKLTEDPCLENFAFMADSIPAGMTRMNAVAESASDLSDPLIMMDTAPAAVLGATFDQQLNTQKDKLFVNIGNMHTIAFIISGEKVLSVFEHHTGELNSGELGLLLNNFALNELEHSDVFDHHGHGAVSLADYRYDLNNDEIEIVVTGPRQNLIKNTGLKVIYAAPFGDMMLTGCYGLLAAIRKVIPDYQKIINDLLYPSGGKSKAPWDI